MPGQYELIEYHKSMLTDALKTVPAILLAFSIALLPGFAVLNWFKAFHKLDVVSRLCISAGVSVGLYVILFEACYEFGIKLGAFTPWAIVSISLASLIYRRQWWFEFRTEASGKANRLAYLMLIITFLVILVTRLWAVRGLVAGMWGDSVHHTLIVQLLLENQGLFNSWQPYIDVPKFTYHFGFHAITALYAWMRGTSAEFAVLMMGQVVNVCAVIGLYALVRLWSKTVWGGLFAVIAGGLISTMPYYYVIWGRYTQLAGQAALLAGLVLLSSYLAQDRSRDNRAYLLTLPTIIAGLVLAQYKVAALFAALAGSLVVYHCIAWYRTHRDLGNAVKASFGRAAIVGGIALLLFLPRGIYILQNEVGRTIGRQLAPEIIPSASPAETFDPIVVSRYGLTESRLWLWWLALGGIAIALIERRNALWFVGGLILCALVTNPRSFGINRGGVVDAFHLSISSYIAVAALSGLLFDAIVAALHTHQSAYKFVTALVCAALLWGGASNLPTPPSEAIFVTPADIQMMAWIKANVPSSDKILTRGFIYERTIPVGYDAGWWIPYYTQHHINLMPMAAAQELVGTVNRQREEFVATQQMYQQDMALPETTDRLAEQGFRYLYVGDKPLSGPILAPSDQIEKDGLLLEQLSHNPDVQLIQQVGEAKLFMFR